MEPLLQKDAEEDFPLDRSFSLIERETLIGGKGKLKESIVEEDTNPYCTQREKARERIRDKYWPKSIDVIVE